MSKPDPAATKSLEEILASICKSLADEPSAPTPEAHPPRRCLVGGDRATGAESR